MEYLILIVTFILTIMAFTSNRILFLIRFFLSCVTCYYILTIKYDSIYLWNDNDYTWENMKIFLNSGLALECIFWTIVSYISFYWLLGLIISKTLDITIRKTLDRFFNKLSDFELRAIHKLLYVLEIEIKSEEVQEYNEFVIDAFTFYIHIFIVCKILPFNDNIYITITYLTLTIAFVIALIFAPLLKSFSIFIDKIKIIS